MGYIKTIKRPKLDDITQLLSALARIPYVGAFMSLLNALMDIYDIGINLFKKNIVERKAVVSSAFYRFCGHALIGLGGLVPLVTIAAFMIFHPCIIPIIALGPVIADLYKFCKVTNALQKIVKENEIQFKANPTEETLKELRDTRELLYEAKRERAISACLVIGTTLSAFGLVFPPLLMAGLAISVTCAVAGFLDKRYRISERISHFIYGDNNIEEEALLKAGPSVVPVQPNMNKAHYAVRQPGTSQQNTPTRQTPFSDKNRNQQYPKFFTTQRPILSAAPALISMNRYNGLR